MLYNVIHREPEPPRKLNPRVPPELEAICLKTLAKRPEDRYAGCAELADDLRRLAAGSPGAARPLRVAERCRAPAETPAAAGSAGGADAGLPAARFGAGSCAVRRN